MMEGLPIIVSVLALFATVIIASIKGALMIGSMKQETESMKRDLEGLSKRIEREQDSCGRKFVELYESRNEQNREITTLAVSVQAIVDRLARIEPKLDKLLERKND
jgi:septal ring factor EnvC (AmiA/AmiB activator)